ncbi:MAG: NAD(P)H-quinone oxidoreductase subunit 3, partial [Elusimicrobia bacterium]|nr:NAD(P)H-quinone oxidoreductase subunit 3 [Elusimicrobiota bacterium]
PVIFVISLMLVWLFSRLTAGLAPQGKDAAGKEEPYACGEVVGAEKAEPDYKMFFPFAVFFTLLHVAGLMIATWAFALSGAGMLMAGVYLAAVGLILALLFVG